MKQWFRPGGFLLAMLVCGAGGIRGFAAPTNLPPARILFLGDSITYSGQYVEFFETFVRLQFPAWRGEILNLGLPSETVSGLSEPGHAGGAFPRPDLHERLDRVLAQTKPDVVIACYGMNDGIYLPFDAGRFERFQDGIRWLREKVAAAGAPIILLTPPTFDPTAGNPNPPPAFNYNDVLDHCAAWLLAQRDHGWTVLDVHGPMNRFLAERRRQDPAYHLAGDGVHPNDTGHWLMVRPLLRHFGAPAELAETESVAPMLAHYPHAAEVLKLVQERQRMLKDAWLTATGHKRPGMAKGLPLAEAQPRATELDRQINALTATQRTESPAGLPQPNR